MRHCTHGLVAVDSAVDHHSGHHNNHDRDDPGGGRPHPRRLRQHQPSVPPGKIVGPGDQTLASPDSSCTSTTGGSNPRPTDYESARSSAVANPLRSVRRPISALIPLLPYVLTENRALMTSTGKPADGHGCPKSVDVVWTGTPQGGCWQPGRRLAQKDVAGCTPR